MALARWRPPSLDKIVGTLTCPQRTPPAHQLRCPDPASFSRLLHICRDRCRAEVFCVFPLALTTRRVSSPSLRSLSQSVRHPREVVMHEVGRQRQPSRARSPQSATARVATHHTLLTARACGTPARASRWRKAQGCATQLARARVGYSQLVGEKVERWRDERSWVARHQVFCECHDFRWKPRKSSAPAASARTALPIEHMVVASLRAALSIVSGALGGPRLISIDIPPTACAQCFVDLFCHVAGLTPLSSRQE